jgi:small subunit ribosomal protein S9
MNTYEYLYSAIGKRKTSVAKVFLKEGTGTITVNQKTFENFFAGVAEEREKMKSPFLLVDLGNKYDITINVKGGGIISKSICTIKSDYKQILNKDLLLRRDSRIKERRKYGLKKARKASQFSKR